MAVPKNKPSMLRCSGCGTTQEAACDCGVGYLPAGGMAAMAIARSPEKSDHAIADEIGVNQSTVSRVRKGMGDAFASPEKRIGRDGKVQSGTKKPKLHIVPPSDSPENFTAAYFLRADEMRKQAVICLDLAKQSPKVTQSFVSASRAVAEAWEKLAQQLEDLL